MDEKALYLKICETLKRDRNILAEIQRNNSETLKRIKSRGNGHHKGFSSSGTYPSKENKDTTNENRHRAIGSGKVHPNNYRATSRVRVTPEKKEGKQSSEQQQWLKKVIFRTLDTFFRIPASKSAPRSNRSTSAYQYNGFSGTRTRTGQVGLDTLKRLSANEADTTSEDKSPICEIDQKEQESSFTNSSVEDDDDKSWIYVGDVLNVRQVTMSESDSLEQSTIPLPPPDFGEENGLLPLPNANEDPEAEINKPERFHYKKKTGKENGNKIRRRHQEKKKLPCPIPPQLNQLEENLNASQQVKRSKRPDSPVVKKGTKKVSGFGKASSSLPDLTEQSYYDDDSTSFNVDDSFAELINTNSFKRGALRRPSSTMKKNLMMDDDLENQEDDDDDLCSSTSSFASFVHVPSVVPKPSALIQDVPVEPINVPIEPMKPDPKTKLLSEEEFSRRSGVYEIVKETCGSGTAAQTVDDEVQVVADAFKYLESDSEEKESVYPEKVDMEENDNRLEHVPSPPPPPVPPPQINLDEEIKLEHVPSPPLMPPPLHAMPLLHPPSMPPPPPPSMPPPHPPSMPPPPPPAMPASTISGIGTLRSRLPLPVYTRLPEGDNIFKDMTPHELEEEPAKRLKTKFPLNKISTGRSYSPQSDKQRTKLKLNLELFLKSWGIEDWTTLLDCISTLNPTLCQYDKGCFAALAQIIPNGVNASDVGNLSSCNVDRFLNGLHKTERLDAKLKSIQFSTDFPEQCSSISAKIHRFIETCHEVTSSGKFREIIEVVMAILNSLWDREDEKIQGFNILSLNTLATKVSLDDNSTTLLHYLIEYILDTPSKCVAIDFHLEFKSLADPSTGVSKISLGELEMQVKEWKNYLVDYKKELDRIDKVKSSPLDNRMDFAKTFYESATASVDNASRKLENARKAFNSCKERYGLSNSEIKETLFFESIAQFISSFRRIHADILVRKQREEMRNQSQSRIPVVSRRRNHDGHGAAAATGDQLRTRRSSCGPAFFRNNSPQYLRSPLRTEEPPVESDELEQCFYNLLDNRNNMKRKRERKRHVVYALPECDSGAL